ncbi:hypothetical protein [Calycomorphotria hydatis]|uniref:Uncharacterized protein n=1 Tax=Calycomorphotria hydatis TaxID=2528027 RepID=A0A517T4U2_9PLAN|nr:hypothetical protein [Calycomorphotria hydatis]QDT63403.1 hypothetical protein V22_06240 [Calycomorphotria hydatis]
MTETEVVNQARQLIKAGDRKQAGKVLKKLLEARPRCLPAWELMLTIVSNPQDRLKCADRIAKLSAIQMLHELPEDPDTDKEAAKAGVGVGEKLMTAMPSGPVMAAIALSIVSLGMVTWSTLVTAGFLEEQEIVVTNRESGGEAPVPQSNPVVVAAEEKTQKLEQRVEALEADVGRLIAVIDTLSKEPGSLPEEVPQPEEGPEDKKSFWPKKQVSNGTPEIR